MLLTRWTAASGCDQLIDQMDYDELRNRKNDPDQRSKFLQDLNIPIPQLTEGKVQGMLEDRFKALFDALDANAIRAELEKDDVAEDAAYSQQLQVRLEALEQR